jgi:hypothetical protein
MGIEVMTNEKNWPGKMYKKGTKQCVNVISFSPANISVDGNVAILDKVQTY